MHIVSIFTFVPQSSEHLRSKINGRRKKKSTPQIQEEKSDD